MMKVHRFALIVCLVCTVGILSGCGGRRVPLHLDPAFSPTSIETVALFPVVDQRGDHSVEVDIQKRIGQPAKECLEKKGYHVIMTDTLLTGSTVDSDAIAEMDDEELSKLVPDEADAIALVYLEDLRSDWGWKAIVPTYEFNIDLAGKLVTKDKGVVWHDKAFLEKRRGGLLTAAIEQAEAELSYDNCTELLFLTLPIR